ncbi:MAG: hypothetical protein GY940_46765 [bacterium]|nr:hypothetical protein [bacterium]
MKNKRLQKHRKVWQTLCLICLLLLSTIGCSSSNGEEPLLTPEQQKLNLESFEQVWTTIRDKHYDPTLGGLDWQAVHDELLPKMKEAKKMSEARAILSDMVSRLDLSHFGIIPKQVSEGMNTSNEGNEGGGSGGDGICGIDIRVIGDQALVTTIEPNSPASTAGVKAGWAIMRVGSKDILPMIERLSKQYENKTLKPLMLVYSIRPLLEGKIGESLKILFHDENDQPIEKKIALVKPKGKKFSLGDFQFGYVWAETRTLEGNIGYIAFNAFLDIMRVMPLYNNAMKEYMNAPGIIIDIRGNMGGLGAMSMGMAGWLIKEKGLSLGTLMTRDEELKFAVLPRPEVYTGPVAILVDGLSASTSEIFAAGLRDLGRARIFGEHTTGAALPSIIVTLPNGDSFQYAVADYRSTGGEVLEGNGIKPDQEIPLTKDTLLNGKDLVMEAAVKWIQDQNNNKQNNNKQ